MIDKILEFIAIELKKAAGVKYKTITKRINLRQGINDLGNPGIEPGKIISISGSVHYINYVLPLSYPMLNYGSGGYIEWGLAAIVIGNSLKIISGAAWDNCEVQVVIGYKE
nr:MAG TPA: hypothetical protein [Caudoviricetes sp.]